MYQVFQDKKGFIWVATDEGLSRYDGYEFKTYTSPRQSSRAGSEIHEDQYGRIWYENFDGFLYYVENDSLKSFGQNTPVGYRHSGTVNNRLFVMQQKGLDIFDLKTLRHLKTLAIDPERVSLVQQTNTHFYILEKTKLYTIDSSGTMEAMGTWADYALAFPAFMQSTGNGLFILSRAGNVDVCNTLQKGRLAARFAVNANAHIQSTAYTDSCYWFCTTQGVYASDKNGKPLNAHLPFFSTHSISGVLKDREGNFWFSTTKQGLLFVPEMSTRLYRTGFVPFKTSSYKNELLAGTRNDELYRINLQTLQATLINKGTSNLDVYNLTYDTAYNRILFTSKSLVIMDATGKKLLEHQMAIKEIRRIDAKYYAYASSGASGLMSIDTLLKSDWDVLMAESRRSEKKFINITLLKNNRGKALAYNAAAHTIYFATSGGLYYITPTQKGEITYKGKSLYLLKLQQYKNTIIGMEEQGNLYSIDAGRAVPYLPVGKLPEGEEIRTIKIETHYLFVLTKKELYYFDLDKPALKPYKVNISVRSNNISDLNLWNDKLVLATDAGLLFSDFKKEPHLPADARFVINALKVNDRETDFNKTAVLNYRENTIELAYSILSFKTESKFPLYYKVNTNDWELASAESRQLNLVSLSPGDYTIYFRLGKKDNAQQTTRIHFIIEKPVWARAWFVVLCALLVLAAAYSYYKWQLSVLRKRNLLLSEKIELEKNLNSSILTSIRSQMNPHFFYNALNTIQSFIFSDDKKNAGNYLSKFSKLTRMILEMSEKDRITLNEEITALTLYLEIEKVRFNHDFEFKILVSEHLDKELVKIPSMLVQPYVENAIKHGLLHKKENKELTISFVPELNHLKITIRDNGIGRKRAGELNKIKQAKHQSFSGNANQLRLEILNKGKNNKTAVTWVDEMDNTNNATGTTVIISVPIK